MSNDPNRQDAELDAELRGAMAALDRATPETMFDGLVDRALARIDDPAIGELAVLRVDDSDDEREDLRALASETKARLSSRRSSQDVTRGADDARASGALGASSAWKSVAMPEPARVVELPRPVEPAAAAPSPRRKIRPLVGGLGVALAAAAGAVIVVTMRQSADTAQAPMAVTAAQHDDQRFDNTVPMSAGAVVVSTGSAVQPDPPPPAATPPSPATKGRAAEVDVVKSGYVATKPSGVGKIGKKKPSPGPSDTQVDAKVSDKPDAKPDDPGSQTVTPAPTTPQAGSAVDPVDAVLHDTAPKPKPKLGRTSLSTDDIKRGMTTVEPRAKKCFAGTAGLVSVRLSVSPSGQVESVTITGPFAGTPVAACVERAVRAAAFPAWDGAPQRFNYSYLLSD